jgi:hypothetical protein
VQIVSKHRANKMGASKHSKSAKEEIEEKNWDNDLSYVAQ